MSTVLPACWHTPTFLKEELDGTSGNLHIRPVPTLLPSAFQVHAFGSRMEATCAATVNAASLDLSAAHETQLTEAHDPVLDHQQSFCSVADSQLLN